MSQKCRQLEVVKYFLWCRQISSYSSFSTFSIFATQFRSTFYYFSIFCKNFSYTTLECQIDSINSLAALLGLLENLWNLFGTPDLFIYLFKLTLFIWRLKVCVLQMLELIFHNFFQFKHLQNFWFDKIKI